MTMEMKPSSLRMQVYQTFARLCENTDGRVTPLDVAMTMGVSVETVEYHAKALTAVGLLAAQDSSHSVQPLEWVIRILIETHGLKTVGKSVRNAIERYIDDMKDEKR